MARNRTTEKKSLARGRPFITKREIAVAVGIVSSWQMIIKAFMFHKPQGVANVRYCYHNQEPRIAPEIICHLIEKRRNQHGKAYRHVEAVYSEAVW